MENEENVNTATDSKSSSRDSLSRKKYSLQDSILEKIKDFPDVVEYIKSLHKLLEKQRKKVKKLRSKSKKTKHASTQYETPNEKSAVPKTIAEEITEAAELATQQSGFVYEETSGMYYDYKTGYYYNAEYGLYYDGNTGTYMTYNQDTQKYEFHSQVATVQNTESQEDSRKKPVTKKKRKKKPLDSEQDRKRERPNTPLEHSEEGECSDSNEEEEECEDGSDENSSDVANAWPPCMRIIVEESSEPSVKEGSLHVITYEGGSLGREGDHSIIIPDINVSKHHLKIVFDMEKGSFFAIDLGSRNGTILNGKRMSPSKQESEVMEVVHGSKIQIGSTVLLCHVHVGNQTCGHCEPGLIQTKNDKEPKHYVSKSAQHQTELRSLRKKFGIDHHIAKPPNLAPGYKDRAQARRDTVGSQNANEKTQVASVNESISSENKGFKMLAKMGWTEGQSLGKDGQGLVEPIAVVSNEGTAGIGSTAPTKAANNVELTKKRNIWEKVQKRYQDLPEYKNDEDDDELS